MIKNVCQILLLVALLIVQPACSAIFQNNNDKDIAFQHLLPYDDVNNSLKLTEDKETNQQLIDNNPFLLLKLENQSNDTIVLPPNYDLGIYLYQDGDWIEIEDRVDHNQNTNVKLVQGSSVFFTIAPGKLGDVNSPKYIRILVVGKLYENGDFLKEVAAFEEISVDPEN